VKAKIEKKLVSAPGTVFKPATSGLMTVLPGKASFHCALLQCERHSRLPCHLTIQAAATLPSGRRGRDFEPAEKLRNAAN